MWVNIFLIQAIALVAFVASSNVVVLDSTNFEHLTQASTGSTTGDWLVKFYAPWCGHCKKLEPIYEEVASALAGEVNVAKVDVTGSRELGTRFEIKGFPTLKLFSKGKVYTYKGKRTVQDIVDFVKGGYAIHSPEEVQAPLGFFGEIAYVFRHAYKKASGDLRAGKFFTIDVFLTFMPVIFIALILLLIFAPSPSPPPRRKPAQTSEIGAGDKGGDNHDENTNKADKDE